jgi:hypothetical protein
MKKLLTLVCLSSLAACAPAFAAMSHRHQVPRAQAAPGFVAPSPPWLAPRDVDEVWGACSHMGTAFSCPGNN